MQSPLQGFESTHDIKQIPARPLQRTSVSQILESSTTLAPPHIMSAGVSYLESMPAMPSQLL